MSGLAAVESRLGRLHGSGRVRSGAEVAATTDSARGRFAGAHPPHSSCVVKVATAGSSSVWGGVGGKL